MDNAWRGSGGATSPTGALILIFSRPTIVATLTIVGFLLMNPSLKHVKLADVEVEAVTPFLSRQLIVGDQIMLARIVLKKGCIVPEHSHHNEQVSYIIEGALRFGIDGRDIIVRSGEVLCIPPHLPHSAYAEEDTLAVDLFNPPRQDWLDKTDVYLRQQAVESK